MKLVPFFLQKKETSALYIYRITFFLMDGGKTLWEIGNETNPETIQKEYLEENGMIPVSLQQCNTIWFAKLDPNQTKKSSFYTWEEIQENAEKRREDCFRTFIFCIEKQSQKLWFHSESCHQSFDGLQDTPFSLFQGLKNHCYKEV
jgi:hypothetical protein